MDTTTIAAPPESAWSLFADLAACGQNKALLGDPQHLAQTIATSLQTYLSCPWGSVTIHTDAGADATASWGHSDQRGMARRNEHRAPQTLEFHLMHEQAIAGTVRLGLSASDDHALQSSGFVAALQQQLELLITLQKREATRQNAQVHDDAASLLSLDLVGQLDLREVLHALITRAMTLAGSQSAAMYMLNEDGSLEMVASQGLRRRDPQLRLESGEGVAGQTVVRRATLLVPQRAAFEYQSPQLEQEIWDAAIGVPLHAQDELIGVLVLLRNPGQPAFEQADQQQIEAFAKPAALIVRNAQLFAQQQQRSRELFVLYENSQIVSSTLQIESLLARVAENITLAMDADRCVVHLIDQHDRAMLYEAASYSTDGQDVTSGTRYSMHAYSAVAGLVRSGDMVVLEERARQGRKDAAALLKLFGFRSALLLALKNRDRTVGFLGVGFTDSDHHFSSAERNLAQTLTSQVAAAIVNAQLYVVEQQRAEDLNKLQHMHTRLGMSVDLEETLMVIFEGIQSLVPCTGMQISLYDPTEQVLNGVLSHALADVPEHHNLSQGLGGWVARYHKVLRLDGVQHPPARPLITRFADATPVRSYLGLPLMSGEQLLGTLELFSHQTHQFSPLDEHLLLIAAAAAARALVHVQRYEQADQHLHSRLKQLTALQHISRQLAMTLSLDVILSFALEETLRATPATQGYIALRKGGEDDLKVEDAKTALVRGYVALRPTNAARQFEVLTAAGYAEEDHKHIIGSMLEDGPTVAEAALQSNEPELVDELTTDDRVAIAGPVVASALAMPIFYEDQVVGVFNLHSLTSHAFDHDAIEFVRAMTDQIALALGNAQRYDEQRRQRELLLKRAGMLNEVFSIGQALRADRSLEEVLEQIAFSVVETADFRSVVFSLPATADAETFSVISGAGMPLADIERMHRTPIPTTLLQRFFDKDFRLGRCFFVPAEAIQLIAAETSSEPIRLFSPSDAADGADWQIEDLLFIPLYSTRAQMIGVMIVNVPADRPQPTRRSVEPLEIFGDQAAIAVENVNLLSEARAQAEQMTALYHVGAAAVSTLDLDELLEGVFQEIVAYMGVPSFFFIASYDEQKETMHFELFKEEDHVLEVRHKSTIPKGGWTSYVIDTGAVLHIHDALVEQEQMAVQPIALGKMMRTWVGIPLHSQNKIIGVLSVQSFEPNAFAEREVQFLSALANQLAVALENARLFREREQRISELDTINHLSRIANSTLDLEQVFHQIYDNIATSLAVDSGFIHVYSVGDDNINVGLQVDGDLREYVEEDSGPIAGSLTQQIMQTAQPLLIRDLREERERLGLTPPAFGDTTRHSASWLGVPLIGRDGNAIGVLSVQSYTPNLYGERELAFLATVASQVALSVQNARLFDATRRQVGELSALLESTRVLSSTLKPGEVIDTLMDVVRRQFVVDSVALWTINGDGVLAPAAMLGIEPEEMATLRVPIDSGLIGSVAASGQPLVVEDVNENTDSLYPSFNEEHDLTSFMGVPVSYREQTVGVLSVMTAARRLFRNDEVMLLAGVADQAAVALANARLFDERERRIGELTVLNQISQEINVTLQLDDMLLGLHRNISQTIDTADSYIALYNAETNLLTFPIYTVDGTYVEDNSVIELGNSAVARCSRVVREKHTLLLQTHQEFVDAAPDAPLPEECDVSSWIGVPIIQGESVLGLMVIQSSVPHAYDENDRRFLETISSQAATAVSNARLFVERERRLREVTTMQDIGSAVTSTLDLDEALERLHTALGKVIDISTSGIVLYDAEHDRVSFPIFYDQGTRIYFDTVPADQSGLTYWVIQNRAPLLIGTYEEAERHAQNDLGPRIGSPDAFEQSFLLVPILSGDEVLGIINIQSYEQHAFDQDDLRFVATVASQAAQAIRNARLYEEVRDANEALEARVVERTLELSEEKERLQAVHDITLQLTASLDINEIMEKTLALASRVVGAKRGSIMLRDAPSDTLICQAVLDDEGIVQSANIPITFESGQGLANWVLEHHKPVCITDVRTDPRWLQEEGRATDVLSVVAVPLVAQDEPLGVLILRSPEVDFFNEWQVQLLTTIAGEISIVMNNAKLHSFITDIATSRAELLNQQREENTKTQAILQSLGEGVIVLNEQDQIVLFNRASEEMLDMSAAAMIGQPLAAVGTYGDSADVRQRSSKILAGLQQSLNEVTTHGKIHTRIIELPIPEQSIALNVATVMGASNITYGNVVVLRDITREIESDRAKRDFVSSVSHELRTPLTSIKGYVDLLSYGTAGALNEGQSAFLSVVKNNTRRLMDLIDDILEIGRIDANKIQLNFSAVDVPDVIYDVLQTLQAEIDRKEQSVHVDIAPNLPQIHADARRFTQVVLNLVSNAVKYTYPEGAITIRSFVNPAGLLEIDVEDTGVGITPEQQKNLFRRFYRADNPLRDEVVGTGLGLSIAKSLVELHGGEMWVKSEIGTGSVFSFIVPLIQPDQAQDEDVDSFE